MEWHLQKKCLERSQEMESETGKVVRGFSLQTSLTKIHKNNVITSITGQNERMNECCS